MIESLISGKLHGNPQQRTSKAGKPFVTAKMRVSTGEEQGQFVNVTAFSDSVQAALLTGCASPRRKGRHSATDG